MSPRSVLVTGGNRGIGLGLVRELLKDKAIEIVITTARKPDEAKELKAINDKRLHVVAMDQDCDKSIKQAYQEVSFLFFHENYDITTSFLEYFICQQWIWKSW